MEDKENKGVQEKKSGGLSKIALTESIRRHVPLLLEKALEIAKNGDSDSNKIGAIKLLLSKVLPDLKATELSTDDKSKFIFQIIKDSTLEDARDKDSTNNSKLPKAGDSISESSKV